MKRTPLRPGTTPIARRSRLARTSRLKAHGRHRKCYAHLRDEKFKAFVRTMPCILRSRWPEHICKGRVEFSHVANEGNGAPDVGNGLPLCSGGHRWDATSWHVMGKRSWAAHWGIEPEVSARRLGEMYRIVVPERTHG